jgi:NAD+ synthase (glutamine-hydrolysing)
MLPHGFVRVAAAVPRLRVADCHFNVEQIVALMEQAEAQGVQLLVFPELCLTGYTCADLFQQTTLRQGALHALSQAVNATATLYSGIAIVGLPLGVDDQLFNCAAVLHRGELLGIVPKSFLPNYKEFYECRWFAPAMNARSREIMLDGVTVPFGPDQLFPCQNVAGLTFGVEICEDVWVPIPPSCHQALCGATVLVNLSASNDLIGKAAYRRDLVINQSARCIAGYVYTSCGVDESTTDVVFGGHSLIAENGTLLAESKRFERQSTLLVSDIDLDRLRVDRLRMNSYGAAIGEVGIERDFRPTSFALSDHSPLTTHHSPLRRFVDPHPFVPRGEAQLRERCEEIFHIQVSALAKRLEHIGKPRVAIGISGGLDSTLALLVTCKTMDLLGLPRSHIRGFTLPGFGTTGRTLANAKSLMQHLGITAATVDIREMCLLEMKALGHRPFGIDLHGLDVEQFTAKLHAVPAEQCQDLAFENVQARMRTSILMNAGFTIGTGDVSELALGWCTYNADHMSMYNPNISIPKTLVKFLVGWAAENEFAGEARRVLLDIVATQISPELLPAGKDGQIVQSTESVIGPYELHDFFLFHFLRYGSPPEKILFLAGQARFDRSYSEAELKQWLTVFLKRFFANQFKRSCLPDGPKVGSISLSPRGDWRMPSDAAARLWLESVERSTAPVHEHPLQ